MAQRRARRQPACLMPSFFIGGFECSTAAGPDGMRLDELCSTGHDHCLRQDYHNLRQRGILAARDGVRWDRVDRRGRLDFSSALPYVTAAEETGITVIWDLFHYGYPSDLDPFLPDFDERFAAYCAAFARLLVARGHGERGRDAAGVRFYTPVNEISFFAWAAGEVGQFAPCEHGRGGELKRRLARTAILGIDAIRDVDPLARFVNCDPLVRVVAPADAPWLQGEADYFNAHYVCEAWDILAGRLLPELGGSPAHLDIVGVNYYGLNQWEHQRPGNVLAADDPRRQPFSRMLQGLYERYEHPIIVTETSSIDHHRPRWIEHIGRECILAMRRGVDLHGLCIYPVVGMSDWYDHAFRPMGLWDWDNADCSTRVAHGETMAAMHRVQAVVERHRSRPAARPVRAGAVRA